MWGSSCWQYIVQTVQSKHLSYAMTCVFWFMTEESESVHISYGSLFVNSYTNMYTSGKNIRSLFTTNMHQTRINAKEEH